MKVTIDSLIKMAIASTFALEKEVTDPSWTALKYEAFGQVFVKKAAPVVGDYKFEEFGKFLFMYHPDGVLAAVMDKQFAKLTAVIDKDTDEIQIGDVLGNITAGSLSLDKGELIVNGLQIDVEKVKSELPPIFRTEDGVDIYFNNEWYGLFTDGVHKGLIFKTHGSGFAGHSPELANLRAFSNLTALKTAYVRMSLSEVGLTEEDYSDEMFDFVLKSTKVIIQNS